MEGGIPPGCEEGCEGWVYNPGVFGNFREISIILWIDCKQFELKFPWDDDEEGSADLERDFVKISGGKLRVCVFAVNGFCARIQAPHVVNPRDYYHRKGQNFSKLSENLLYVYSIFDQLVSFF